MLYKIWQLISNIDPWIEFMTFHVQLLKGYTMFWEGGHVSLSPG